MNIAWTVEIKKYGSKGIMSNLTLTIIGRPISKKNSKQMIIRGGTRYLVPSTAFSKFQKIALMQIPSACKNILKGKTWIHCVFYIQGKYHVDGDNLLTSILDVLQAAQVITDDDLVIGASFIKHGGCRAWSTQVYIYESEAEWLNMICKKTG